MGDSLNIDFKPWQAKQTNIIKSQKPATADFYYNIITGDKYTRVTNPTKAFFDNLKTQSSLNDNLCKISTTPDIEKSGWVKVWESLKPQISGSPQLQNNANGTAGNIDIYSETGEIDFDKLDTEINAINGGLADKTVNDQAEVNRKNSAKNEQSKNSSPSEVKATTEKEVQNNYKRLKERKNNLDKQKALIAKYKDPKVTEARKTEITAELEKLNLEFNDNKINAPQNSQKSTELSQQEQEQMQNFLFAQLSAGEQDINTNSKEFKALPQKVQSALLAQRAQVMKDNGITE